MSSTLARPRQYWVETPWRAWGVVYGADLGEVVRNAEIDRAREIAAHEAWIARIRSMPIEIERGEKEAGP